MRKFLFIAALAVLMCTAMDAKGQTAAEVDATVAKVMSAKAPCNQGPEAFKTFIGKFSTDSAFMESRVRLTDDQREKYASLLVPDNFTAKRPFAKDDDEYYQAWGEIQYTQVYLDCGWVDSYVTHTFEFKRIGGKWYLDKVVPGE